MAVGKISYNGGSGVKGAGETPYTIHADSEPIKSGNFVEKVIRFEEGSSTANDIVLDTLPTTTSAITKVENNRLLTATVTNTALVLRLYDTTQSTVPTLLDHWTLQTPSVRSVDLLYMSDNRIVFAFAVGSEVNAGMIAIDEDEITLGEISTALTHYVYKVLLCKVNANRFAIFTNAGSSAAPYVSYAINSDLTISNPTAIKTYNSLTPSGWISCDNAEDNKIIIALTDSGFNNNLAVTICLYNAASNTLSMGDLVNIPNTSRLAQTVKTISATQALLVYQVSENMLNARLLTMDPSATSTTITVGGIISLKSTSAEFKSMSLIEYEPNKYML